MHPLKEKPFFKYKQPRSQGFSLEGKSPGNEVEIRGYSFQIEA